MNRPTRALGALALFAAGPWLASAVSFGQAAASYKESEVPSRTLSREFTREPRLAGTTDGLRAAKWVAERLTEAGWQAELDPRVVLLSLPRSLEVAAWSHDGGPLFRRVDTFDPDAEDPADVPKFNAWSANGTVNAEVVDVGRGLRDDYERLLEAGVDVAGKIALTRYGGSYRGVKVERAEEFGCVGVLLFTDPASDGAGRGTVWPAGRFKPGWAAQRGSIAPLAKAPGDPSTPGWASPAPGETARRLSKDELDRALPKIPCLPIGSDEAGVLLAELDQGTRPRVELTIDAPRELRTIHNVIGRLPGEGSRVVLAGNHRDAWVRGAHDAGSGTITLLRAAQILGERARGGWKPANEIALCFWDAEEPGLIGSTEWGEANAEALLERAIAYVNADAAVSGTLLRFSGTPGLMDALLTALEHVPPVEPGESGTTLAQAWRASFGEREPRLSLPGSGSDYTVFLHHLGIPILDFSFGGESGGHYHTRFDDFEFMDRFLDPTWAGHETAGAMVAALLTELAARGETALDPAEAARAMADVARNAADEAWFGPERSARLASAFDGLAGRIDANPLTSNRPRFYVEMAAPNGLEGRSWFKNRLWAPGLETGYASERLPSLRHAANEGDEALDAELADLLGAIDDFGTRWVAASNGTTTTTPQEASRSSTPR